MAGPPASYSDLFKSTVKKATTCIPRGHSSTRCIDVRDGGGGGRGGSCPPQKITKSKSRANVQHKSGEEWEIKKPKMPKSPQFVGQTKAVGRGCSRAIFASQSGNIGLL